MAPDTLIAKARPSPCCRRLRSVKEHRRRQIDTMFGHLRVHAPRFEACACGRSAASSPVASLFPHRTTPELRHLQVKLGSKLSYKQAADILNEFLPDLSCFNHATTRNRVLAVGRKIEAETRAEIAEKPTVATPADHMIVGIDGAFVKAARTKINERISKSYSAGSTLGAVRGRFSPRSAISMIWLAKGFARLFAPLDVGRPPILRSSPTARTPCG